MLETIEIEPAQEATASVIWLHGLGADGHDFARIVPQLQLADTLNVRFIFPHAPIRPVTINANMRMRAWFNIRQLENMTQEDAEGIHEAEEAVNHLIQAEEQRGIKSERIILAGFSQGGALALYAGLRSTKPLAGIIGLSTFLPFEDFMRQVLSSQNRQIAIFMAHGDADPLLPLHLGKKTAVFLKEMGYRLKWHEYGMAHQVCMQEILDIGQWLNERLL